VGNIFQFRKNLRINQSLPKKRIVKQKSEFRTNLLNNLQALGKALQFPIAVLPFAAILNRFGALGLAYTTNPGVTINGHAEITNAVGYWISFIVQSPGAVIFANLALFFAIGCGFGLAKDNRGEAALAAVAFFVVNVALTSAGSLPEMIYGKIHFGSVLYLRDAQGNLTNHLKLYYAYKNGNLQYILNIGVIGGIVAGCFTAFLYNRTKNIQLPQVLSFFGGRRFVPMLAITLAIPTSFIYAIIWPWVQFGLTQFGYSMSGTGGLAIFGAFAYGVVNRLLQPFGMHQILNTFLWFQLPITGPKVAPFTGQMYSGGLHTINGDVNAYINEIFGSGNFQSGFFPMFLGGLPAVVFAIIVCARKEHRKAVMGFFAGAGLVSFLTGIDEPILFSFCFVGPQVWLMHCLYTGVFAAIVIAMHIHVGFGFSAGFIDYLVSMPQAWGFSVHEGVAHGKLFQILSNPLWILPLSVVTFVVYFFTFKFFIRKFNIMTPGREKDYVAIIKTKKHRTQSEKKMKYVNMAKDIIEAVGEDNITVVSNCATRLRLELKDNSKIDKTKILKTGVYGLNTIGLKTVHIIVGTDVEHVTDAIKDIIHK